jgi:fatty acid desaturase
MPRSQSPTGRERAHATGSGLAGVDWYQAPVDRKFLKELMKRSDQPALRDTAIWLGPLVAAGANGIWPTGC